MLQIHNSLTKCKEPFAPIEPGHVRMYVCGMTVYDYCHLGHARVMVFFDTVVRYLRACGLCVTYVRNITDIDDKIIKRAHENGESIDALTARYIAAMYQDTAPLGVLPPDVEPRATEHIAEIQQMIGALLARAHAYRGANGDVYYDVSRFASYGALSGRQLEDLRAGARVEIDEAKNDPLDFVLWKAAKPGEPSWDSPWGSGRPGWHIECSAMSTRWLGEHFDIHGGGMDLAFPHHENEIAQSEAATGHKFVNLWMHIGFVQVDEEKMSKSLGNFFTIREILARYDPEVVRYFLLASHYRSPLNYTPESLDNARAALTALYIALRGVEATLAATDVKGVPQWDRFQAAMDDDFNTPKALAALSPLVGELNIAKEQQDEVRARKLAAGLRALGGVLGLLQGDPDAFLQGRLVASASLGVSARAGLTGTTELSEREIEKLMARRAEARRRKDYAEADRIRDELESNGILLEDRPTGTTWRRA